MRVRMLPISFVFSRFPRMVRDLSGRLGKHVELKMTGDQTELDKTVMEKIGDPLVHLVRNSVDHGIEMPDVRAAAGKSQTGTVFLNAYHKGGTITVEVGDDGGGLNKDRILKKARERSLIGPNETLTDDQIYELIFMAGFSTAEQTTDISGRGVGMDVVRRNIKELGGTIEVTLGAGQGLALHHHAAADAGDRRRSVGRGRHRNLHRAADHHHRVAAVEAGHGQSRRGHRAKCSGSATATCRWCACMKCSASTPRTTQLHEGLIMVVEGEGRKVGLFVDDLLGQQQVVIKSLETNFRRVDGVSGATILGDGAVALILDVPGLIRVATQRLAA